MCPQTPAGRALGALCGSSGCLPGCCWWVECDVAGSQTSPLLARSRSLALAFIPLGPQAAPSTCEVLSPHLLNDRKWKNLFQ